MCVLKAGYNVCVKTNSTKDKEDPSQMVIPAASIFISRRELCEWVTSSSLTKSLDSPVKEFRYHPNRGTAFLEWRSKHFVQVVVVTYPTQFVMDGCLLCVSASSNVVGGRFICACNKAIKTSTVREKKNGAMIIAWAARPFVLQTEIVWEDISLTWH